METSLGSPLSSVLEINLADSFTALREDLDRALTADDIGDLGDDDLCVALSALEGLSRQVHGLQVAMAGEATRRSTDRAVDESLARTHGCKNATEFLQRTTLASARELRARVRLGAAVASRTSLTGQTLPATYEHVATALGDGSLSVDSATLIVDTLQSAKNVTWDELDYAQRCLVEAATGDDFCSGNDTTGPHHVDSMRVICRTWNKFLDQDGNPPSEEAILRRRGLRLGTEKGGLIPVVGTLLPEVAATLARLCDAINSPRSDKDETPAGDVRTAANKRHDALASILNVAASSSEIPSLGGAPVTVLIQTTRDDLRDRKPGWIHGHDGQPGLIAPGAIEHAACSGTVEFYSQSPGGRIIELGTTQRVFNAKQRHAITVRDGGCVIPDCTVPPTWCEIHHVIPHSHGGPTHTDNGVMLCYHHHRTLGTSGWDVRMKNGYPEIRSPRWIDPSQEWRSAHPPHKPPVKPPATRLIA